jgi:hypothetical protein
MMEEPIRTDNQPTDDDFPRIATSPLDRAQVEDRAEALYRAEAEDSIIRTDFTTADPERPTLVRNEAPRNVAQNAGHAWPYVVDPSATTGLRAQDAGGMNPLSMNPLLSDSEIGDLRSRWSNIQAAFVDEPRQAVEQADELVATAMQRLQEGFSNERAALEKQWESGKDASTEDLRLALQRYRTFFGRLLSAA